MHGASILGKFKIFSYRIPAMSDKQTWSVYVRELCMATIFTMLFVYDNIDRRELTLSGGSTTHQVNGIII